MVSAVKAGKKWWAIRSTARLKISLIFDLIVIWMRETEELEEKTLRERRKGERGEGGESTYRDRMRKARYIYGFRVLARYLSSFPFLRILFFFAALAHFASTRLCYCLPSLFPSREIEILKVLTSHLHNGESDPPAYVVERQARRFHKALGTDSEGLNLTCGKVEVDALERTFPPPPVIARSLTRAPRPCPSWRQCKSVGDADSPSFESVTHFFLHAG